MKSFKDGYRAAMVDLMARGRFFVLDKAARMNHYYYLFNPAFLEGYSLLADELGTYED